MSEISDMMNATQREMLALCIEWNCAWTTAKDSPNDVLLRGWVGKGWAQSVEAPPGLVAYAITDSGRQALGATSQEGDE